MSESVIGIGKAKVEVRTGKYRTAFAPRDNQSAANQIALLHSILVDRDERLAEAEAAARWCERRLDNIDDIGEALARWPWLADEEKGGRDE